MFEAGIRAAPAAAKTTCWRVLRNMDAYAASWIRACLNV
jgi:hypothetical protein